MHPTPQEQPKSTFSIPRLLFLAALCLIPAPLFAQQLAILKKIPPELLRYTGGAWPDAAGLVGYNRGGFRSPELQRGAMQLMLRSIVAENRPGINAGWKAINATFEHQTPLGHFARDGGPVGGPSAVAFWLCELNQAILVLRESDLAAEHQAQIDHLLPKIHLAARWLAQKKYRGRLEHEDADTPNRLLFDALAYGLSGLLAAEKELQAFGRQFVDRTMKQYRDADGVFLEKGGHDSSYQAVAALKLQIWITYFPDPKLEAAARQAVRWEIGRVKADGTIDVAQNTRTGLNQEKWQGNYKDVNLSEVTFCLLYDYARTGNQESLAAAKRIIERRRK